MANLVYLGLDTKFLCSFMRSKVWLYHNRLEIYILGNNKNPKVTSHDF